MKTAARIVLSRLLPEQERERDAGEDEDDHERRQRAERVDVVGAAELDGAAERSPRRRVLDHHDRDDEPDEREPGDRQEREPGEEERGGQEGERAEHERTDPGAAGRPDVAGDRRGPGVREREHRRGGDEDRDPLRRRRADGERVGRGERDPERQRDPVAAAVEPDRLRDDLPDGARLGRQRRRQCLRAHAPDATATSRGSVSASFANASSKRQSARSGSSIAFETTRTSTAGTPASSQARRTAKPSIASTSTPCEPPTRALVPIGRSSASGKASRSRASRLGVRERPRRHERSGRVAVDRLRAEHERQRLEPARAGDADVEDGVRTLLSERAGRRDRRLDRPDPADERPQRPRPARAPARSRRRRARTISRGSPAHPSSTTVRVGHVGARTPHVRKGRCRGAVAPHAGNRDPKWT